MIPANSTLFADTAAMQLILDTLPNPVFVKDTQHRWVLMNQACANFIGLPVEQLLGKSDFDVVPEDQARQFWEDDDRVLATGQDVEVEERITVANGVVHWLLTRKRRVQIARQFLVVCAITDVTALHQAEERSRYQALHDSLTGLPNRVLFQDTLETLLTQLQRRKTPCALLCLDLDGFKMVNDTLGHPAGDELLRQFAARMTQIVRPGDVLARMGGDEFAILVEGVDPARGVETICERVVASSAEPFHIGQQRVQIGASVGVIEFDDATVGRGELMHRADVALYHAKHQGRGRYSRFNSEMEQVHWHRTVLEAELGNALSRGGEGLELRFQPLIGADDGRTVCVEALVRWRHPRLGLLLPAQFVRVAEESGQISALEEWVMDRACAALKSHSQVRLALNMSSRHMQDADLPERIDAILARHGFPASRLDLEVSEVTLVTAGPIMIGNLARLRKLGVQITLDNFGTGHSIMRRIDSMQISRIKIDRSFVQQIDRAEASKVMVQAITQMARAMKLAVTAVGVETRSQSDFLLGAGCNELQGHFICDAVTEEDLLAALPSPAALSSDH